MPLVALGAALNLLAITVNGGVMPASPAGLAGAGLGVDEPGFQNSAALAHPRLAFLGDAFYLPASWPLGKRLQRRGRADRPRDCLGAAPHLPVTPGPFLDPPTLVTAGRQGPGAMPQECLNLERHPKRGAWPVAC
jgi:hypothetical protein